MARRCDFGIRQEEILGWKLDTERSNSASKVKLNIVTWISVPRVYLFDITAG
jgi:hypothetical protein